MATKAKKASEWLKAGATVWYMSVFGSPVRCTVDRVSRRTKDSNGDPVRWVYLTFIDPRDVHLSRANVTLVHESRLHPNIAGAWMELAQRERAKADEHLAKVKQIEAKAARGDLE
jgi:hypothetical protein